MTAWETDFLLPVNLLGNLTVDLHFTGIFSTHFIYLIFFLLSSLRFRCSIFMFNKVLFFAA